MWIIYLHQSSYPRFEDITLHVFSMTKLLSLLILESRIRNPISVLLKYNLKYGRAFQSSRIGAANILLDYLLLLVMLSNKNYSN